MDTYFDTGVLVPLYTQEVYSDAVKAFVNERGKPIFLNLFQRLEIETALRLKAFRGESVEDRLNRVLLGLGADLECGRLVLRPVNWIDALEMARTLAQRVTAKTGCRTLDLVHVAIAVQWGCAIFVSADERQLAAAKREGLRTVDVRALHHRCGGDDRAEPNVVREPRVRYRSGRRAIGSGAVASQGR